MSPLHQHFRRDHKIVLDSYDGDHFVKPDGSFDKTTIVTRVTELLLHQGLKNVPGVQSVAGVTIYPAEYFNPKDFATGKISLTENTRCIHHFDASWYSPAEKFEFRIATFLRNKGISNGSAKKIAAICRVVRYLDLSRLIDAIRNRID